MQLINERKAAYAALRRRFQRVLRARLEKDRKARMVTSKMRRPRYDEIYFKGVEWLDTL
jgi:hypothetical protein